MPKLKDFFQIEEDVEFFINEDNSTHYRVHDNILQFYFDEEWTHSGHLINSIKNIKIMPKFTLEELAIMRSIEKCYKYLFRDGNGDLFISVFEPIKSHSEKEWVAIKYTSFNMFNHIFKSCKYEDDTPIEIDKYVDRDDC